MTITHERRPHEGAATRAGRPEDSLSSSTVTAPADALVEAFAVVTTERGARRRLYLSLHSAQKAVQRAAGCGADAELVRLVPVGGVE